MFTLSKASPCRMPAGFGFAVWVLGSVGCAFAPTFWVLILCRVVMGAGEASIITLSNPFIDDVAPPTQKTLWFGILNLVRPPPHLPRKALPELLEAACARLQRLKSGVANTHSASIHTRSTLQHRPRG